MLTRQATLKPSGRKPPDLGPNVRAEAVRLFMNQHGVPLNRMATISYGEKDPVADNKTRGGRAQNRRVVLIVMS